MGSVVALPITVGLSLISSDPSDFIVTYCKWLYSYFYLIFSRWSTKKRFDVYNIDARHDPYKVGFLSPQIEIDMESPQSDNHMGNDEVFFYGVNSSSECLVVRIARQTEHHPTEAWIYLKLKGGRVFKLDRTLGYHNSGGTREFTSGGLRIHYNATMRRWRIFYNGLLREISEENPDSKKMMHVKFALLWRASSDLFDATDDINSAALAMGFAKTKWKTFQPPLKKLNEAIDFYAQAGTIFGTVMIDEEPTERQVYLFGERVRFFGNASLEKGAQIVHALGYILKNGTVVHIAEVTIPGIVKELRIGFVVLPYGLIVPLSDFSPQMENLNGEHITAIFHAQEVEFKMNGHVAIGSSHIEREDGSLAIDCLFIQLNGDQGNGVLIKREIPKSSKLKKQTSEVRRAPKFRSKENLTVRPLAIRFSEDLCQDQELTGGKGSSLGKLNQLSKKMQNFIVPNGIVVTTAAYALFINKEIQQEIRNLEDVLYGNVSGDVKEACQRVIDEIVKANIPDTVLQAMLKCLQESFGEQLHTQKFAVRSSATGEDTEQMSAAGQMETFLGVSGLSEIISSLKKCWGSQFSFIAAQYKRQYGQLLHCPMAVVIQQMVPCDVAGVLFTCDPLTGNPTLMSITANYGLGESVVSGSEEPDTIILKRNELDELELKEKIIGAKSRRIVMKDDEGTSLEDVTENEKSVCCLSDALALRLGKIAVQMEKSYQSYRDIEWGLWNNNLYIFQSRPVTSGTGETDFEIDHEMDGPMRVENEYYSVCNVGEVMPGALSPLGLEVVFKYFLIGFQRNRETEWRSLINPRYFPKGMVIMSSHVMFYLIDFFEQINDGNRKFMEASMVGLFGRVVENEELFQLAKERFKTLKSQNSISKKVKLLKCLFTAHWRYEKWQKLYADYRVPVDKLKDPKEVFNGLMYVCDDISEAFLCHMVASQNSSVWNIIIFSLLEKYRGGINSEVYRDFAQLLSSISGVESAGVPCAMQSLAYHISKEVNPEDFKKMEPEEILEWLKSSPSKAGVEFRKFLKTHGHRCLKEFDVMSYTWAGKPQMLAELLQNLVGNVSKDAPEKKVEDVDQMLSSLGINLTFFSRILLKYIFLPQTRTGVQTREHTKSLMIKLTDEWRKGYRHLAKLMVSEGRIPDEDLLFFMYLDEIRELLDNRSPKIISRANHRRRRHPILDKYIFPEIQKGFPKPINADDSPVITNEENFKMEGIPVSQGVAKGFVRVALTLEEASHLKHGEILLTYSTDIGWTPYFPSLAGVVTELGGLISHGAVVSREYGLPCIAGLHGATRQFQTGDYVLLDGNRGILQKLAPPQ